VLIETEGNWQKQGMFTQVPMTLDRRFLQGAGQMLRPKLAD
jgi:hypothetical protein